MTLGMNWEPCKQQPTKLVIIIGGKRYEQPNRKIVAHFQV
jgi:hypothetical protein